MLECSNASVDKKRSVFVNIRNKYIQIAMGSLPIMILWCVASYYGEIYSGVYLDSSATKYAVNCLNAVGIIPVLLIASAFIYKRYSMKVSFIASVFVTALPVIGVICSDAFRNDGNILSWIFAFTLAIPMYPFIVVGCEVFKCGDFYFFAIGRGYLDYDLVYLCFFNAIMISILIFTLVKPKKAKAVVGQEYVNGINQQNFFNQ